MEPINFGSECAVHSSVADETGYKHYIGRFENGPYISNAKLIAAAPSLLSLAISQSDEIARLKKDKADAIFFASKLEDELTRLKAEIAEKDERMWELEKNLDGAHDMLSEDRGF